MRDLDKALADILAIRSQIATATAFRGYGPAALAATGGLALVTALAQALVLDDPTAHPFTFFIGWAATAAISAGIIGFEMHGRSQRLHSGLADAMIHNAIEQFLPAAIGGAAVALLLLRLAPDTAWTIPGLWQLMVSLGLFASVRSLPRGVVIAAAWYFVAGLGVLMLSAGDRTLSPWSMGLPFVVGQLLLAGVMHLASGSSDAED